MNLEELARWYSDNLGCEWKDDSTPQGILAVVFRTGLCDDFAWAVHKVTGWPVVRAVWRDTLGNGHGYDEHHAFARAPDGRYVDACGWIEPEDVRYYAGRDFALVETEPQPRWLGFEDGLHEGLHTREELAENLLSVLRELTCPPFGSAPFTDAHDVRDWVRDLDVSPGPSR